MANLGSLMVQIGADTSQLRRAEQEVKQSASTMSSSLLSVGNVVKGIAFAYAANQARLFASQVIDTGMKLQQLTLSFKAISGSTEGAAQEMGFIRKEASRLGQDAMSLADAYKGIAAAAKGTSLEGKGVREVFSAVSEAATVLGLSSEQTGRSLYALSQMISKGKVSSEELRQQLGENLPGAFNIAAEAMGMTTQEFDKMLSEGKILTEDFLPKFAGLLHEKYSGSVADSANSARAASNRLANAFMELQDAVWKRGEASYSAFLSWLSDVVMASSEVVESFGSSEEVINRYGTTVDRTSAEGESSLERMTKSVSTFASTSISSFADATAEVLNLGAALMGLPEVKSITVRWYNEVFGGTPEEMTVPRGRQQLYASRQRRRVGEEVAATREGLSPYQIDPELARLQGSKRAGKYGADIREADTKTAAKAWGKYGVEAKQKFDTETANIKRAMEASPDWSQEAIQKVLAGRQAEWDKLQAKGGKSGGGGSKTDTVWEYNNRIAEEGRRIVEGNYTATEKYNSELEKLSWYLEANAITQDQYDRAVQATWNDLEKANQMSEGWQGHLKIMEQGKSVFSSTRTEAEKYADELDKLNYLLSYGAIGYGTYQRAVKELENEFKSSTDSMSEFAIQAARNIQDALGDQLYNVLTGNFDDIGESFGQMIAKMVAQATAAQLGNWLFGDFGKTNAIGGLAGTAFGVIGNWFSGGGEAASSLAEAVSMGGGFAEGGITTPGKAYIVGERGPELFYPGIHGTVVPNASVSSSSSPPNIDIVINNETGQKVEVDQKDTTFDGQGYHASVSLKLLRNNVNGYRDAMKSILGGR